MILSFSTTNSGVCDDPSTAQEPLDFRSKFVPENGRRLLLIGQDLGSIGGTEGHTSGYFENVSKRVGGVTTYTALPGLDGLAKASNWGAGDIHAQALVDSPHFRDSAIAIGLYLVDQLDDICEGNQDAQIDELADWISSTRRPIFLRIGYEFDGYWNHYEPASYKAAFRRIADRFRSKGVDNCAFVWQSCTSPIDDTIDGKREDLSDWYPGDEYVDWCGCSCFLHTAKQVELSDELLNFARARNKPVMICESACKRYDLARGTRRFFNVMLDGPPGEGLTKLTAEETWDEWFAPYFQYIEKNQDVIRAVAYINANWDVQPMWGPPYKDGYWGDSRIEANALIRKKWLAEIRKPVWIHESSLGQASDDR